MIKGGTEINGPEVYWEGDKGDRSTPKVTEFSVFVNGLIQGEQSLQLVIDAGNGTYNVCGITPDDMMRIGKFLIEITNEVKGK